MTWDLFHDLSSAVLVLVLGLTVLEIRALRQRIRVLEQDRKARR